MTRLTIHRGPQQDDAWRRLRLGCATGSVFADVLATGKGSAEATGRRNYRVRLALELLTGELEHDGFTSWAIKQGIEREPLARSAFEAETGLIVDSGVSFMRLNHMPVGVSPDGLIDDDEGLEIKCPTKAIHLQYLSLTDSPPAEYQAQVQGCMFVTGRKRWHFVSYNPDFPLELQMHHIIIERDEEYIKRLEDALWKFTADVKATVADIESLRDSRRTKK